MLNLSLNLGINNVNRGVPPFKADLALDLRGGITESSGNYYFINEIGDDLLIDNNIQGESTSVVDAITLTPIKSAVDIPLNGVITYNFERIKLNQDLDNTNPRAYSFFYNGGQTSLLSGILIKWFGEQIRIFISDGSTLQEIRSLSMPTGEYVDLLSVTVNTITNKVLIDLDGVQDEHDLIVSGDKAGYDRAFIGSSIGVSPLYSIGRFFTEKDSVITVDIPFSTGIENYLYDTVTGTEFNNTFHYSFNNNKPNNLLNGHSLWYHSDNGYIYVPRKKDGTYINTTALGYSKISENPAGDFHNYCESKIKVSATVSVGFEELTAFPFTKYFSLFDGKKIYNILGYATAKTDAEIIKIVKFLGYTTPSTLLWIGDSIAQGAYGDSTELTEPYLTHPTTNIWSVTNQQFEQLSVANCDEPTSSGTKFGGEMSYSTTFNDQLRIIKYAIGGSTAGGDVTYSFSTTYTGSRYFLMKTQLLKAIPQLMYVKEYPVFKIICCLGTNDADDVDKTITNNFRINIETLLIELRKMTGLNTEFHMLRCRLATPDRITVGRLTDEVANVDPNVFIYNPELITGYADGVHPNTAGNIELGILFANETHFEYDRVIISESGAELDILTYDNFIIIENYGTNV